MRYVNKIKYELGNLMEYKGAMYSSSLDTLTSIYIWKLVSRKIPRQLKTTHELNPELKIVPVHVGNRKFNVIRDDYLIGGTKQRMLYGIMKNSTCTEFVYAGPVYGFAQIALSYAAKKLNKVAVVVIEKKRPLWNLTAYASQFNPRIIEVGYNASLKSVQRKAIDYVLESNKDNGEGYSCLIPFGLGGEEYTQYLSNQIKVAVPDVIIKNPPKTMWLVAGSATLLNALYKVFPDTFFKVVQVGKKVWKDQLEEHRTKLYVSKLKFQEDAKELPPYPSVKTYDAKAWEFISKYGENEDYIWNVGKDV